MSLYNLSVEWRQTDRSGLVQHISLCRALCLPHRTCRRTRAWGPDCRAPGGLCRSTAACASCTWAPSTRSEGTWLWVQRSAGSCPAAANPAPADLKYRDKPDRFLLFIMAADQEEAGEAQVRHSAAVEGTHPGMFAQHLKRLAPCEGGEALVRSCASSYSVWWQT